MAPGVRGLAFASIVFACGCGPAFTADPPGVDAGAKGDGASAPPADGSSDAPLDGAGALAAAADARASDDAAMHGTDATDGAGDVCAAACPSGFTCAAGRCEDRAELAFSSAASASGNWSYGYASSLSGPFVAFTSRWTASGAAIDFWGAAADAIAPSVFHDPGPAAAAYDTMRLAPGQLGLWPGPSGAIAIVRFTPPAPGSYSVDAVFDGISYDDAGAPVTTTFVGVRAAGPVVLSGQTIGSNGAGDTAAYSAPAAAMDVTDVIEFYVSYGANMDDSADATSLSAVIAAY